MVNLLPKKIDAVVFDFDGVFTDNHVLVSEDGKESVFCNRADGMGIALLQKQKLLLLVLSSEQNKVVETRCQKLGLEFMLGVEKKHRVLSRWIEKKGLNAKNVVYVGNDINDLQCIKMVGCGVVVNDAHPSVVKEAKIILSKCGGHGAVRELCDLVLKRIGGG